MPLRVADTSAITIELIYRELIAREQLNRFNEDVDETCDFVTQSLNFLRRYQDELPPMHEGNAPPLLHTGCVGYPKFQILCTQIEILIESRFSDLKIAQTLSIIRRKMSLYGLSIQVEYAQISDDMSLML